MGLFDNITGVQLGRAAGGLFGGALDLYGRNQNRKQMERMITAQSPNAFRLQELGGQALTQAGSMDPRAFAQRQFNEQQGLRAGADAASFAALERNLVSRGLTGLASDDPGAAGAFGVAGGQRANPYVAAYFAAQNAQRSKDAADAQAAGQTQLDRLLTRGTDLSKAGQVSRAAGIENVQAAGIPRKRNFGSIALGIGRDILKDSGLFGTIGNTLKELLTPGTSRRVENPSGSIFS